VVFVAAVTGEAGFEARCFDEDEFVSRVCAGEDAVGLSCRWALDSSVDKEDKREGFVRARRVWPTRMTGWYGGIEIQISSFPSVSALSVGDVSDFDRVEPWLCEVGLSDCEESTASASRHGT
jgi:hypothetical protein